MLTNHRYIKHRITFDRDDKKEARGINDDDLGEVQVIDQNTVTTTAGVVDKITYIYQTAL